MEKKLKIMVVFGTRPEAIKMAPLIKELKKLPNKITTLVTVTAQHRQMLDQVLDIFEIVPEYDLNIMKEKQSLFDVTKNSLDGLNKVLFSTKPDLVLVHGDTTTTFIASLAAFYHAIPIGHVEAGLRTNDKYSPFPEEINRQLTGVMADIHFTPTEQAKKNLLLENKKESSIFVTGNTIIDALRTTVRSGYTHPLLTRVGDNKLVLMTVHRRENIGKPMENIFNAIRRLVDKNKNIHVVYPMHMNPVVREIAYRIMGSHERIHLTEPLDVIDFHNFAARSYMILTDSGGIQEEAPSMGVPVLVLRDTTERPEGIEAGTLKLTGTDEETVFSMADELLNDQKIYNLMAKATNPYGDGHASRRIVEAILNYFK